MSHNTSTWHHFMRKQHECFAIQFPYSSFYLFATIGISDKANNILASTISVHGKISQSIETITLSCQTLCPGSSITDKGMVVMMVSKTQTKNHTHQQPTDLFHEGALSSSPYLFFTAYHHSYHTTIVLVLGGFVLFCFLKELYFSKLKYSTGGKPLPVTGEKASDLHQVDSLSLWYFRCLSSILTHAQVTHWSSFGIFTIRSNLKSSYCFVMLLILFSFGLSSAIS